jgi:hypothetical protein
MELDKLLEEIARLKEANELLDKVWTEVGPYNNEKISDKTMRELQRFFNFDDSE